MHTTSRLALPLIMPAQAQKHLTHNEALVELDALVQLTAISATLTTPPASAADGDVFLVPANASWEGRPGDIAVRTDAHWRFVSPKRGWRAFALDRNDLLVFDGEAWTSAAARHRTGGAETPFFGVATDANDTARLAVASKASLFTHAGADARVQVNKAAGADTASVVFQTGYSGRAEVGTAGSDRLSVKVSADGAAWKTALTADPATGFVGIGGAANPACTLDVQGSLVRVSASGFAGISMLATGAGGREYRLVATDNANGLGGGKLVLYDQTSGALRFTVSPAAFEAAVPVKPPTFAKAALPAAGASGPGAMVYVPDESGGGVVAFSDGTNWRRVTDRAIVS